MSIIGPKHTFVAPTVVITSYTTALEGSYTGVFSTPGDVIDNPRITYITTVSASIGSRRSTENTS